MSEEMKMDAERARVVDAMCMTWRHDFGLDKREHKLGSCGMTDEERDALRRQMCQLYDHHFAQARASLPVGVPDDCPHCQGHGEVTRTSGQTAESYSEHNEECPECCGTGFAPSAPAGEAVPVGGVESWRDQILRENPKSDPGYWPDALIVAAMGREIEQLRAALTAKQSAPERVSVPVELLRQGADLLDAHSSGPSVEQNIADDFRDLLSSHGRGEA